jgi:hypothetical protein
MTQPAPAPESDGLHDATALLDRIVTSLEKRVAALGRVGEDWAAFLSTLDSAGGAGVLLVKITLVIAATILAAMGVARFTQRGTTAQHWLSAIMSGVAALLCGAAAAIILSQGMPALRTSLFGVALAALIGIMAAPAFKALIRRATGPVPSQGRLRGLRRLWFAALLWGLAGMAVGVVLRLRGWDRPA